MADAREPWNLTEPQRRQLREARAEARQREAEVIHTSQSRCPVCGCDPDNPWYDPCDNPDCPCSEEEDGDLEEVAW